MGILLSDFNSGNSGEVAIYADTHFEIVTYLYGETRFRIDNKKSKCINSNKGEIIF